jgi:hypothetical protein
MIAKARGGALTGEREDHPAWIPQRLVTSKRAAPPSAEDRPIVNLQALKDSGALFDKNINVIRNYPNIQGTFRRRSNDDVAQFFINHVKDNLLALHDSVPEEVRNRSKMWYDGAEVG